MKSVLLRSVTLLFAIGVLTALVVHASVTSGCSKSDAVRTNPSPLASVEREAGAGTAFTAAASNASAPPGSGGVPSGTASSTESHAGDPLNYTTSPNRKRSTPLGGSKSGMIFRPQSAAPETSAR